MYSLLLTSNGLIAEARLDVELVRAHLGHPIPFIDALEVIPGFLGNIRTTVVPMLPSLVGFLNPDQS